MTWMPNWFIAKLTEVSHKSDKSPTRLDSLSHKRVRYYLSPLIIDRLIIDGSLPSARPSLTIPMSHLPELYKHRQTLLTPPPPAELSDKSVSTEEQQRLKLAFAEGYLSGGTKQTNTTWGGKVFQGLYNALRIGAIVLLIYVVFGGFREDCGGGGGGGAPGLDLAN